jgi:hypothetical protein
MPEVPREFTDETCAPAKLTSALVISRGVLGALHRTADGLRGNIHIHDVAFFDSFRRLDAHAQNADGLAVFHASNQRADLGRANVDAYNNFFHIIDLRDNTGRLETPR